MAAAALGAALLGASPFVLPSSAAAIVAPLLAALVLLLLAALWRAKRHPAGLHDSLTRLPNRALFEDRLAHALAQSSRDGDGAAVMVIDLDRFKAVNDTFGHPAGDALLRETATRLASALRSSDTVARIGGDEFGVVLSGSDLDGARETALRMRAALEAPVFHDGASIAIDASIGIAVHPVHGSTAAVLLQRADAAMYEAKRAGVGYALYDAAAASSLASELHTAVERGELCLYYQARFDLRTDDLAALEALVRWRHPTLGILAAEEFMPLAEERGLAPTICERVIDEAAAQCARWNDDGFALPVSVNVDGRSLVDSELPRRLERLLARHGISAASVELELSEDVLLTALAQARSNVFALAELGVHIVVDDFGIGHTSLGYLAHVPVSKLKIHRSLVLRAETSRRERIVLGATVALAHDLGVDVVAEGVEDEACLEFVRSLGADYAQGYHLGAPAPATALAATLQTTVMTL